MNVLKVQVILTFLIALIGIFALVAIIGASTGREYAAVVLLDTSDKYQAVIVGNPPCIDFGSLRDTPISDQVKILRVRYHALLPSERVVLDWLGSHCILAWPEMVR